MVSVTRSRQRRSCLGDEVRSRQKVASATAFIEVFIPVACDFRVGGNYTPEFGVRWLVRIDYS